MITIQHNALSPIIFFERNLSYRGVRGVRGVEIRK